MRIRRGFANHLRHDNANHLMMVGRDEYTWDFNGNLLSDGQYTYDYDEANRLSVVHGSPTTIFYSYNGLGDRVSRRVFNGVTNVITDYTNDIAAGLTQVLADDDYVYLYGNGRVAQYATGNQIGVAIDYFLTDALGSVRQLVNQKGEVTLAKAYEPFGEMLESAGDGESTFAYTGEAVEAMTGYVYLRARFMDPATGRFTSRDVWEGDYYAPMSYNGWLYVFANPLTFVDPLGLYPNNYVFYFSGAGNWGDISAYAIEELVLETELEKGDVEVFKIYPYGSGNSGTKNSLTLIHNMWIDLSAAYGLSSVPKSKAQEILEILDRDITDINHIFACSKKNPVDVNLNITLIGYSGGGQIAYSTAQELSGDLEVDNIVLLGAPYRAYDGLNNIGHLWDVIGDLDFIQTIVNDNVGWEDYNRGLRYEHPNPYNGRIVVPVLHPELSIYNQGATKCTMNNTRHNGSGWYFDQTFGDFSIQCQDSSHLPVKGSSRLDAVINFLREVVGVEGE